MHACIVVVSFFGASWHPSGPEMTILHAKLGTHHHGMHCALLRGHQQHAPICGRVPTVSRCRVHSRLQSSTYRPQHVWGRNSQRCDAQHTATQADREDARPVIVSSSVWQPCLWIYLPLLTPPSLVVEVQMICPALAVHQGRPAMLQPKFKHNLFLQLWFKHDLRIDDHPGLHYALSRQQGVVPLFCFDPGHQNLLRTPHGIEGEVCHGGQQCAPDGAVRAARGQRARLEAQQATAIAVQHSKPRQ